MASVVEQSVEIGAPVDVVFDYVDDFGTTKDWMYGLHRIDPVGEQRKGLGAEYDGVMKLGVSLTSRIRCTGYEPIIKAVEAASQRLNGGQNGR